MIKIEELLQILRTRMKNRINNPDGYDDDFLISELESAKLKVAERRFCDVDNLEDKYKYTIVDIALYNVALIGGDYQSSHSENGVNRVWVSEEDLLKKIVPKARCI